MIAPAVGPMPDRRSYRDAIALVGLDERRGGRYTGLRDRAVLALYAAGLEQLEIANLRGTDLEVMRPSGLLRVWISRRAPVKYFDLEFLESSTLVAHVQEARVYREARRVFELSCAGIKKIAQRRREPR